MATDMQVWVGSLASYNAGTLYGEWLDVTDKEAMQEEIAALMASDPAHGEEWAIMDTDGFGDLNLGQYPDLDTVCKIAELVEEHGEMALAVIDYHGLSYIDEAEEALTDHYAGTFRSVEEWAEEFVNDCYDIDTKLGQLANYFDYEAYANDAQLGGDIYTVESDGMVHVFHSN